jgi:hypothetical protein
MSAASKRARAERRREERPPSPTGTERVSLLALIPTNRNIAVQTAAALLSLQRSLYQYGHAFEVAYGQAGDASHSRNSLAGLFLRSAFTHALWLDSDMSFAPQLVLRMLALGHEFTAGAYRAKVPDTTTYVGDPEPSSADFGDGTVLFRAVGFGLALHRRSALEKMTNAYARELTYNDPVYQCPIVGLFDATYIERGASSGGPRMRQEDDYAFCLRWRAIGGRIHVMRDVQSLCHHEGPAAFPGGQFPGVARTEPVRPPPTPFLPIIPTPYGRLSP